MAESDGLGIGKFGSLGLAFMAAVVSAGISWGVQINRADQDAERIHTLSTRMTTLGLQIHNNALSITTLRAEVSADTQRVARGVDKLDDLAEIHHRLETVVTDLAARVRALEELQRRQVER